MLTLRVTLQSGETHDVDVAPETVVTFKTTTLDGRLREQHEVFSWSGVATIDVVSNVQTYSAMALLSEQPEGTPLEPVAPDAVPPVEPDPPVAAGDPGAPGDQPSEPQPTTETGDPIPKPEPTPVDPPVATDGSSEPSTPSPSDSTDTSTTPASTDPMTDADTAAHDAAVSSAASAIDLAPIVAPEAVPTLIAEAQADLATALANWPDSPELADAKAKLDTLAAETDGGTAV